MWTDSVEEVVISMPIKPEVLRSLSVYTDGENVTLTWQNDSARSRRRARARSRSHARAREPGLAPPPRARSPERLSPPPSSLGPQIVIPLFDLVVESETGPARVKGGIFSLPMKKAKQAKWPSLTKKESSEVRARERSGPARARVQAPKGGRRGARLSHARLARLAPRFAPGDRRRPSWTTRATKVAGRLARALASACRARTEQGSRSGAATRTRERARAFASLAGRVSLRARTRSPRPPPQPFPPTSPTGGRASPFHES